jgi:SAM-dependent methyltransferase
LITALERCFRRLPASGSVLDVGCLGFVQVSNARSVARDDLRHAGVDQSPPNVLPAGFDYRQANLDHEPIPFPDDSFDLVVASHVLEHVTQPLQLIQECIRVCRPGGRIYVEAPSERSLLMPGMPFWRDDFRSLSFYDDPTHLGRPWTPQAFFRAARHFGCRPVETRHIVSWRNRLLLPALLLYSVVRRRSDLFQWFIWTALGWACFIVIEKPAGMSGFPELDYRAGPPSEPTGGRDAASSEAG